MKKSLILLGLALLMAGGTACTDKKPETRCVYGNDIPQEELDNILVITDYLAALLAQGELKAIYEQGSEDLKSHQTRDQFVFTVEVFFQAFGKVDFPRVVEVYQLIGKSKNKQVNVSCNLGEPGINDVYNIPANKEMAVAVYDISSEMEAARLVLQMEKQDDQWKIRSLTLNPKTIKKKTPDYYLARALEFREQNRLHAAVLYMKTAMLLHDIGLNVNEFTVNSIQQQVNQIKVDYMPAGKIQNWATDAGNDYQVYNLDTAYDHGSLLVQISYMTETLSDHDRLEKEARELAGFLDEKFPEYRLGFDGIRITAAPEKREEFLMSYHTAITFAEMDKGAGERNDPPEDKGGDKEQGP